MGQECADLEVALLVKVAELPAVVASPLCLSPRKAKKVFTENTSRLKAIKGLKWTKYPDDVLPAFVADMDFESPIAVTNALEEMVRSRDYGYRFNDIDQLISLWVEWVRGQHGLEIAEDECIIFTSSIQALEVAMMMHTGPGDGVALFSPVYHPFASAVEDAGRRLVDIPLRETDWKIDIDRFRDSIDERTRIVLFCQPHNPTGHIFTPEELNDFSQVVVEKDLLVISDEIWADLTLGVKPHYPLVDSGDDLRVRTITIGSASKTFNLAGARCSIAHIGHPKILERIHSLPIHFLGQPSSFGAAATAAAWKSGHAWLEETKEIIRANSVYVYDQFLNSNVEMCKPEATYLAWLNFSKTSISENPAKHLLKAGKVALEPGSKFGRQSSSYARLNFATDPEILEEIVKRVIKQI